MKKLFAGMTLSLILLFANACGANPGEPAAPKEPLITVFIAGDSTASSYEANLAPRAGWGQMLQNFFTDEVLVRNEAASGRSSKSFIEEGRLDKFAGEMKEGDVLIIQFGHNDAKTEDPARYTDPQTTYKEYLSRYIEAAQAKGAVPVLATPVHRNSFDSNGKIKMSHGLYPGAVIELAKEKNVALIDMTEKTRILYESLGPDKMSDFFLHIPINGHPNYMDGVRDNTHFQEAGASEIAKLIVEGIKENKLELAKYIKE